MGRFTRVNIFKRPGRTHNCSEFLSVPIRIAYCQTGHQRKVAQFRRRAREGHANSAYDLLISLRPPLPGEPHARPCCQSPVWACTQPIRNQRFHIAYLSSSPAISAGNHVAALLAPFCRRKSLILLWPEQTTLVMLPREGKNAGRYRTFEHSGRVRV